MPSILSQWMADGESDRGMARDFCLFLSHSFSVVFGCAVVGGLGWLVGINRSLPGGREFWRNWVMALVGAHKKSWLI